MLEEYLTDKMCSWIDLYKDSVTDITITKNENMYLSVKGCIIDTDCFVSEKMFQSIVSSLCRGSLYANQATLKKGFMTLENGCRVGMVGEAVTDEGGNVTHLRNIDAVNIRICRDVDNCAEKIMEHIYKDERVFNTLIIAPPGAGKTTLLRDIAKELGKKFRVGVSDERDEIVPLNSRLKHGFVMRGTTKSDGMLLMLRSMSPQVIITDEIGTSDDESAILKLINSGVKVVCSVHGYSEEDILRRETFRGLIEEKLFETIVVLSSRHGPGTVEKTIQTKEDCDG